MGMMSMITNNDVWLKIKKYIEELEYGKIVITIHQGKVSFIEKQEKEKIQ